MRRISSPPMPATTTSSASCGDSAARPSDRTQRIRSETPKRAALRTALSSGAALMSAATAETALPLCSRAIGRYPWSVPTSATRTPQRTKSAHFCSRGSSAIFFFLSMCSTVSLRTTEKAAILLLPRRPLQFCCSILYSLRTRFASGKPPCRPDALSARRF